MVARLIPMHKLKHARASILALLFAVTIFVSVQMSPASALVPNILEKVARFYKIRNRNKESVNKV